MLRRSTIKTQKTKMGTTAVFEKQDSPQKLANEIHVESNIIWNIWLKTRTTVASPGQTEHFCRPDGPSGATKYFGCEGVSRPFHWKMGWARRIIRKGGKFMRKWSKLTFWAHRDIHGIPKWPAIPLCRWLMVHHQATSHKASNFNRGWKLSVLIADFTLLA